MMRTCLLIAFSVLTILSCTKKMQNQDAPVTVIVSLENLTGKTGVNRSYIIDSARLFFSHFELVDNNGNAKPVKDLILVNSNPIFQENSFSFTLPSGAYTKLRFHFGLDHATNNSNPVTYDASNPLSLEHGMYWGPLLKYTFLVAEGRIDSSAARNQTPVSTFSMNLGTDTLYREVTRDLGTIAPGGQITIHVDLNKLFVLDQNIFNITYFVNHSTALDMPNGIVITDSVVNSITSDIIYPL